jgi:hypothetical protein
MLDHWGDLAAAEAKGDAKAIERANRGVDTALRGVDTAQLGVDSLQRLVNRLIDASVPTGSLLTCIMGESY